MHKPDTLAIVGDSEAAFQRIEHPDGPILGAWYWVRALPTDEGTYHGVDGQWHPNSARPDWLGCIMKIGSNFVELRSPQDHQLRVHLDDFYTRLRVEPNPGAYLRQQVQRLAQEADEVMTEIKEVTARIGMTPQVRIGGQDSTALAVIGQQADPHAYKNALVKAKDEELPELFKRLKDKQEQMVVWMKAEVLPMKAELEVSKDRIGGIDDRIFSISLYAGLTEEAIRCADGHPADITDKLHVMQRMLFMDEECLFNYRHGGMEFRDIGEFDAWMAQPENRDRILPFPRTMVVMRVRRFAKERSWGGSLVQFFQNIEDQKADKFTFIYIRNGEQVWRINTELEFDELVFPDATVFNPDEPKMFQVKWNGREVHFMSIRDWEDRLARAKARKKERERQEAELEPKREAWKQEYIKEHPENAADAWFHMPYELRKDTWDNDGREVRELQSEWEPFDQSSVHFDEGRRVLEDQFKKYNRIALIIQGLFDRSPVLHPHLPVRSWTQAGFDAAITLVNDSTMALTYGEPPDFEAYRERINRSIREGSLVLGQQDYWMRKEAEKENKRRQNDWRLSGPERRYDLERYKPYGDPGPAEPGRVDYYNKGQCVFRWSRERKVQNYQTRRKGDVECRIQVPVTELFNVDAYQLGDYKQFFRDPRTRSQYLQWAPFMLMAEEIKAGNNPTVETEVAFGSGSTIYHISAGDKK